MTPTDRARLLDAEMALQRAWLELNLRDLQSAAHAPAKGSGAWMLSLMGMFKHRSMWMAALSLLLNIYRRTRRS